METSKELQEHEKLALITEGVCEARDRMHSYYLDIPKQKQSQKKWTKDSLSLLNKMCKEYQDKTMKSMADFFNNVKEV